MREIKILRIILNGKRNLRKGKNSININVNPIVIKLTVPSRRWTMKIYQMHKKSITKL